MQATFAPLPDPPSKSGTFACGDRILVRFFGLPPGGADGRSGAGAGDQFRGGQPAATDRAPRLRVGGEPDRVRDVMHNFDADGFDALYPRYRGGRPATFSADQRAEITKVARGRPTDHGLPVSTLEPAEAGRVPGRQGVVAKGWSPRGGRRLSATKDCA